MTNDDPKYPLTWKIRYAMRFGRRQSRLLDRIALVMKILMIGAGTTAFVSVIGEYEELTKWSGLIVAAIAIIDAIWNPAGKAAKSREIEQRFALLIRDAPTMTPELLQRAMDELYDSEAPELESLRPVVYNDMVSELGNKSSEKFRLTPWQKFIEMIA